MQEKSIASELDSDSESRQMTMADNKYSVAGQEQLVVRRVPHNAPWGTVLL